MLIIIIVKILEENPKMFLEKKLTASKTPSQPDFSDDVMPRKLVLLVEKPLGIVRMWSFHCRTRKIVCGFL